MRDTDDAVQARTSVDRARVGQLTSCAEPVLRLEVAAVRLGSPPVAVGGSSYAEARPDPLYVRLCLPSPVAAVDELPPSLTAVLRPRCGCCTAGRTPVDGS